MVLVMVAEGGVMQMKATQILIKYQRTTSRQPKLSSSSRGRWDRKNEVQRRKKKRKKNWKAKEKRSEENRNTKKNRSRGRNCCWLSMGVREEMEEEGGECPGGSARQKIMKIFPPQMSAKSDSRQGVEATRRKEQPRIQDPGPLLALSVLTRIKDISATTTTRRENSMENCRATQLEKMTKFIKKRREKKISRKRKKNRSRKTDKGGEGQRRE